MNSEPSPQAALAAMYDESAELYARHWAPALNRHARDLVDAVPAGTGLAVVDVAAGAGTLAPSLVRLAGDGGLVLALDRSQGMLRRVLDGVPRAQADAAALPLGTATVDVVALAFVLFLLPDARAAVDEAARVLSRGGWLLAATWGTQLGTAADVAVREELDAAGAPPAPALPRSDELTDTPERMAELLGPAGFRDVRTQARPLDAAFDRDTALALRTGAGGLGWRFARLVPERQEVVRRRAAARLAALPTEDFIDRSEVLLTWARRD